jgi:hypothetical protein
VQRRTRVNIREDERISAQRYGRDALPRDPAWQVSRDQLGGTGQILPLVKYCRWSNIAVARFLDMPRRIAQERVPRSMSGRAM